jgi:hypothetical protein
MNVKIGAEAALFPEKEYINGIFIVVRRYHYMDRWPMRETNSLLHKFYIMEQRWCCQDKMS